MTQPMDQFKFDFQILCKYGTNKNIHEIVTKSLINKITPKMRYKLTINTEITLIMNHLIINNWEAMGLNVR